MIAGAEQFENGGLGFGNALLSRDDDSIEPGEPFESGFGVRERLSGPVRQGIGGHVGGEQLGQQLHCVLIDVAHCFDPAVTKCRDLVRPIGMFDREFGHSLIERAALIEGNVPCHVGYVF